MTLARGGHKVIATMRNLDGGSELRKIVSAEGLPVTVAALDVDDDGSVTDAVGARRRRESAVAPISRRSSPGAGETVEADETLIGRIEGEKKRPATPSWAYNASVGFSIGNEEDLPC